MYVLCDSWLEDTNHHCPVHAEGVRWVVVVTIRSRQKVMALSRSTCMYWYNCTTPTCTTT